MSYTTVVKPGAQSYTNIPKPTALSYVNPLKPLGSIIAVLRGGRATGLITPPTYASSITTYGTSWININKPT